MTGTAIATTDGPAHNTYWTGNTVATFGEPTTPLIMPPMLGYEQTGGGIIIPSNGTIQVYTASTSNTTWIRHIGTSSTATNIITPIATTTTCNATYITVTDGSGWVIQPSRQYTPEEIARFERRNAVRNKGRITKARSAIKKALKLIDNMGFGDEIRIFIGGDEIVIDNPESIFKFVLKRGRHSIIERTMSPGYSTPYSLELLTKDDVHVSNLCVYLKDTPVLDQILAVAMYIKTGNEEDVLEKANWFNRTDDDGVRRLVNEYNPKFGKKLGFKLPEQDFQGYLTADNITGAVIANNYIPQ